MSTDTFIERDFLAKHGPTLLERGYTVVPIQPGKKAPGFDGWQKAKPSKEQLTGWLKEGFAHAGVGILTKWTCAIDIDCHDEATALKFEKWCHENIGHAPVRVGKAPKRLLLYRTSEPFRKRRSAVYTDEWNQKQLIEVLGDGQQFVAYHIHPDTGRPYEWINGSSPLTIRAADLPEVKQEKIDELLRLFEAHATAAGWDLIRKTAEKQGAVDRDNPWAEDSQPIDISVDELRSRLMLIPVDGPGYDQWMQVGMALYHQFDGDDEGFELWNEWSETSMDYDLDELQRKWPTFEIEGKKRAPVTGRFIMRLAKESVEKTARELSLKLRDAFTNATNLDEWEAARKLAREAEIDSLARSTLAAVAKDRRDAITGHRTPIAEIKKAISFQPRKNEKTPKWCEDWIYDTSDDKFYNTKRKTAASKQGFDASYDRQALTKQDILNGKDNPTNTASDLALNVYKIPVVDGRLYMPGRDPIFHEPNGTFANTYPEHEIPEMPKELVPQDKKNIDRVKAHIVHLLESPKEQRMLLDWLSWVVQNPGKFMRYAVLLQGTMGDGKTFFAEMLRAVMGVSNVKMANANTIIKSDFTEWAVGQCVCCVEEIRLRSTHGIDKWEAINKIKDKITNAVIEIHPKGSRGYNVMNTTSYLMFSNYQDALPLEDNERRYMVLFSRWQRKEDIEKFNEENPKYYARLYQTLLDSPGALRKWLLEHEQDEDFDPMGRAPDTMARRVMTRKAKPEFIQVLDELLDEDEEPSCCRALLDVTELQDILSMRGVDWPSPKALSSILERDGYEALGKVRIGTGELGGTHRFYSRSPDQFKSSSNGSIAKTDPAKVRAFIAMRQATKRKSLGVNDPDPMDEI